MTWQAISVSAVGEKHIKAEEPCQDCASFAMLSNDQVLIGAVSDGMGSATHSELGSQITVKVVISQLRGFCSQSSVRVSPKPFIEK